MGQSQALNLSEALGHSEELGHLRGNAPIRNPESLGDTWAISAIGTIQVGHWDSVTCGTPGTEQRSIQPETETFRSNCSVLPM